MNLRSIPIVATIIVVAAVATMIMLGFWQLGRADEKAALLASYGDAEENIAAVAYPKTEAEIEQRLYRRSSFECAQVAGMRAVAGTSANGRKGWAHLADCERADGGSGTAALGWSNNPQGPDWPGGTVSGVIAPGGRIVADPPLAGLDALVRPDPADLPNNHMAYAVQWFLFALTALVIFVLAVRWRKTG